MQNIMEKFVNYEMCKKCGGACKMLTPTGCSIDENNRPSLG